MKVVEVTIGAKAADDGGTWRRVESVALVAHGDFAVVADTDAGLLAPDVGPPRALWNRADHGAIFGEGLLVGGAGCLAEFAMKFVLVGMRDELVEELVGSGEFDDVFCGQQEDEAFLSVVVAAFDFAFGLGRGGVEQFDPVAVEGRAELDADGDGYSNLEEMLAGTQPDDALGKPGGPPYLLSRPALTLNTQGGQLKFGFSWPDGLVNRFQFGLDSADQVGGPYHTMPAPTLTPLGAGHYEIQVPIGSNSAQFYQLTLRLSN